MGGIGTMDLAVKNTKYLTGEVWECGVFEGDTSVRIKRLLEEVDSPKVLRLFDSFEGMPYSGLHDVHEVGVMKSDVNAVKARFADVPNVEIHKGIMPASFGGLEGAEISIAWIDVDNYESVKQCLNFVYPRVQGGGWVILDDYFCTSCPGAKLATDEFLKGKKEHLIVDDDHQNPQVYFVKGWLKLTERNFLLSI